MGARNNGAKTWIAQKYFYAHSRTKLWKRHLLIRGSCWGRNIKFKFAIRVSTRIKNAWVGFTIPYAMLPHRERAK